VHHLCRLDAVAATAAARGPAALVGPVCRPTAWSRGDLNGDGGAWRRKRVAEERGVRHIVPDVQRAASCRSRAPHYKHRLYVCRPAPQAPAAASALATVEANPPGFRDAIGYYLLDRLFPNDLLFPDTRRRRRRTRHLSEICIELSFLPLQSTAGNILFAAPPPPIPLSVHTCSNLALVGFRIMRVLGGGSAGDKSATVRQTLGYSAMYSIGVGQQQYLFDIFRH
jgi:hypothetical protein